jgi:signal transduction histidine kinase
MMFGSIVAVPLLKGDPKPEHGIIDLRGWDFNRAGIVKLDGEWEFYWDTLLTPADSASPEIRSTPPVFVAVPHLWKTTRINGKKIRLRGCATYRAETGSPAAQHSGTTDLSHPFEMTVWLVFGQTLIKADRLAALGLLSATVAHEINNPTNAILQIAQAQRISPSAIFPIRSSAGTPGRAYPY